MRKYFFIWIILFTTYSLAQKLPTGFRSYYSQMNKVSETTPQSNSIDRILIQDGTIWLGMGGGLSKSTDNGNSWTNYNNSKVFGAEGISAVEKGLGAIWVATYHTEDVSGSDAIGVGSGLKYTTDSGNNWISIDQPVDNAGDTTLYFGTNKISAVPKTDFKNNFTYGLAFIKNSVWIVSMVGGLRRSDDYGKTWKKIVLPPEDIDSISISKKYNFVYNPLKNLSQQPFSILAVDDTLYVGTAGGLLKTTDAGNSWSKITSSNRTKSISGNFVFVLAQNPFDKTIWASTRAAVGSTEYNAVSSSNNGGRSWNISLIGDWARGYGFKNYPVGTNETFAATENNLYRSSNNGVTWVAVPKIKDSQTNVELKPTKYLSVKTNVLNSGTSEIWIGTNDGLAKSIETSSDPWWAKWKVYFSSGKSITTSESFAFPNPFNPKFGVVRIKYNLTNASNVTLRIMDFGMNLVRTVLQNVPRVSNPEQVDFWDGKDENGKFVPNGVYFYRLDVDGGNPLFGKIIVLM
jgi:hypothetical protein